MNNEVKITLTSVPSGSKYPWLVGRPVWHWTLSYNGQTFDDGGHDAMEVEHAADSAIEKYRDLYHEGKNARRIANRTPRKAAA